MRKTKLSAQTLLLLLAGAVAIAYVILSGSLLQQHLDQDSLSSDIESAQMVLAASDNVSKELKKLPARVDAAEQELAAAEVAFPTELESNNILQTILEYARQAGVLVASVDAVPPEAEVADSAASDAEPADAAPPAVEADGAAQASDEPVEETAARQTLTLDLSVEGSFGQVIAFFQALEKGTASTSRVENFTIEPSEAGFVANIELVVYARSPAGEAFIPEDEDLAGEEAASE